MHTMKFGTDYMDKAVFDLPKVIDEAVMVLTPHLDKFDTLVGTGFSGGMVIPMLATRLGKTFVLIRKETDDSHHGQGRLLGELGARWIFVDDFVSSGRTKRRVIEKIESEADNYGEVTELVGQYMYQATEGWRWSETTDSDREEMELARESRRQEQERLRRDRLEQWRLQEEAWANEPTLIGANPFPRPGRTRYTAERWTRVMSAPDLDALRRKLTAEPRPEHVTLSTGKVYRVSKDGIVGSQMTFPVDLEPLADWEIDLLLGPDEVVEFKAPPMSKFQTKSFDEYLEPVRENSFQQEIMAMLGSMKPIAPVETPRERFKRLVEERKASPAFTKFTKSDFRLINPA